MMVLTEIIVRVLKGYSLIGKEKRDLLDPEFVISPLS